MATEWIVAAVFVVAGVVAAAGLVWGVMDPVTRRYKPGMGGLFRIGRPILPPDFDNGPDKAGKDKNGGPGPSKS